MKQKYKLAIAFVAIAVAVCFARISEAATIRLTEKNTVVLRGEITASSVEQAMYGIGLLNMLRGGADSKIYLVMDSPGGSIQDGMDFIEYAKSIKNLDTITIFAASMASAIVEALPGRRYMTSTGTYMFHRARGGFQGQFETGEVESQLQFAKSIVLKMEQDNASRLSMGLNAYKEKVLNEWWLFGADAVRSKAADEIVTVTCTDQLIGSKYAASYSTFFGEITVVYSGCPLFRNFSVPHKADMKKYEASKKLKKITQEKGG